MSPKKRPTASSSKSISVGGNVVNSALIAGNNNIVNYFSGDYVSLKEYYIPPDSVFQRVRVDEFVGREWLTAKVDTFLNDPNQKSGAFLLVGDAGVGKTAFMAHLVKERRYLHLFAEQVPGQAMLQRALQSLGSQLVTRYQIDPHKDRDTLNVLAGFPDFLERLLRLAASTLTEGEKIVIVCDALDEAGVFPDHFVFGLPKELPDGVYLILSQRPVNTKLPNFEPLRFDLEAQGEDNLQDMEAYLSAVAKRPAVVGQIRANDYSEAFFIQTLKEKSLGVWMYLHYVIKEIERGQRAPLDLESLPKGLVGYYADYWDNWRSGRKGSDATKWDSLYAPLLATLAASQEGITIEKLIEWAGTQVSPSEVTRLLKESWSSFITEEEEKDKTVYTLYHQSLRDFITGKVEDVKKLPPTYASLINDLSKKKVEAHQRIVNAFEAKCDGEWEKLVEQDYPRLHLTAHLNGAKEFKKLTDLLTEGDEKIKWAEAREKKEETYAGYLNDLTYVWAYAEREQNYSLTIRCMLIESSIHSLASNIPPELLAELAKEGLWSYARCLATIKQIPADKQEKGHALALIVPCLPQTLLLDAMLIALAFDIDYLRQNVLQTIFDRLNLSQKMVALESIIEIQDESLKSSTLDFLIPYLDNELIDKLLNAIRRFPSESSRAEILASLTPYLNENLSELALVVVDEIQDELIWAMSQKTLIAHLNGNQKNHALNKAVVRSYRIGDEYSRSIALAHLAGFLDERTKLNVIQDSLSAISAISNEARYIEVITTLTPYLNEELKEQVLISAKGIKDENSYVNILMALSTSMSDGFFVKIMEAADKIENGILIIKAFKLIAQNLSEKQKIEFFESARETDDMRARAFILDILTPCLSNDLKVKAIYLAREIKTDNELAHFIEAALPISSDELNSLVLKLVFAFEDAHTRTNTLVILIPHLSSDLHEKILNLKFELGEEHERVRILEKLALHVNGNLKLDLVNEISNILDEGYRTNILNNLSLNANKELAERILTASLMLKRESCRTDVALSLISQTKTTLANQILGIAYQMNDVTNRAKLLEQLIPFLDKVQIIQILEELHPIRRETIGVAIATFPYLEINSKIKVLWECASATSHLSTSEDVFARCGALAIIALYLKDKLKTQLTQECFRLTREMISDSANGVFALFFLAPLLKDDLQREALNLIFGGEIESVYWILIAFSPHLNKELAVDYFDVICNIEDESDRSSALIAFIPHLSEYQKEKVFSMANEFRDGIRRASVLSQLITYTQNNSLKLKVIQKSYSELQSDRDESNLLFWLALLAQYLDEDQKTETLNLSCNLRDETNRAMALSTLMPFLNHSQKERAEAVANQFKDDSSRLIFYYPEEFKNLKTATLREAFETYKYEYAVSQIAEHVFDPDQLVKENIFDTLKEHFFSFLRYVSNGDREKGFVVIKALTPALIHFRGLEIAPELYRTITDVTRWWP